MKKAWMLEKETMENAEPVVLTEEQQGWSFCEEVEAMENRFNRMKWKSNVPGSGATEHVVVAAMQDTENMGYDVTEAEKLIDEGMAAFEKGDDREIAKLTARAYFLLANAPKKEDHPYWNYKIYDSFDSYAAKVKLNKYQYDLDKKDYLNRTYYGWTAQICAGAIGTAIEGYTTENITRVFGQIRDYPRTPNTMNDDITYELAFLKAADRCGKNITAADIGEEWVALIPFGWSAEEVALKNLRLGIYPPQSGYSCNPYREWIGAQMRGAICGMVAPGNVYEAARLAFMDGTVSHHNNGVLGEVFNAVMVSLAYIKSDVREIVKEAIAAIPSDSEYYDVVNFAYGRCEAHTEWMDAWKECEKKYERYNWIHAYPNAAAEIVALYYGNGDFDETMHISAQAGYDVDCNAAQIASVVAIANNSQIDERWIKPLGDRLQTYMRDIKEISVRELSADTVRVGKKLR